jgi:hypothetical protein
MRRWETFLTGDAVHVVRFDTRVAFAAVNIPPPPRNGSARVATPAVPIVLADPNLAIPTELIALKK